MKKILSLFVAFVLGATLVSAKTIYCKMEYGWWKADGAAVGCHSWGDPGPGTTWPGVRMTPVEGETDLWSIELDTDKVQNVIFTRMNPSDQGNQDWGAKTKDLQIPNDDKNLFTITSSSAVWGDPGCEGEWSKYTKPAVITYKDSVYYVAGNFTNWAAEMKELPASVELPADSALAFKQVLTRTVLADGDSVRQDTIWFGQANEGSKMTRESSAWKLDGEYNVLATTDVAGTYTFSLNENGEFVLGWPDSPATKLNNVKAQDGKRYNIFGQQVKETYRGIVIMNGQTYLQ